MNRFLKIGMMQAKLVLMELTEDKTIKLSKSDKALLKEIQGLLAILSAKQRRLK